MSLPNLFKVPGWNLPSEIQLSTESNTPKESTSEPIKPSNKREIKEEEINNKQKKKKKQNQNKELNIVDNKNSKNKIEKVETTKKQPTPNFKKDKQPQNVQNLNINPTNNKNKNKKNKLRELLKNKQSESTTQSQPEIDSTQSTKTIEQPIDAKVQTQKLTPLQVKMQKQLAGAKFRQLNELLYTIPSEQAYKHFQSNPQLFTDYHAGFSSQTDGWPLNPNDVFINFLKSTKSSKPVIVADMGCGEAKIAESLQDQKHIKIHSFDLVKGNKFITPCDIRSVPMKNKTCDYVIFSLSLMGVNYVDFLKEAKRILKLSGELKIAEVKSRFEDVDKFIKFMKNKLSFELVQKDESNKMFILMNFKLNSKLSVDQKLIAPKLKPCIYKRR